MLRRKRIIAGIDLGGTSMQVLIVDQRNNILAEAKAPTRRAKKPLGVVADIAKAVEEAMTNAGLKRSDLTAASIGAPGPVDRDRGIVHEAPNLGWFEFPLGPALAKRLRVPVVLENDVNAGTLGEHVLGAGVGASNLIGIFVGTGIGGGLIINSKLYEGSHGGAGEIGHMLIVLDGPLCGCGHRGCVEAVASRTAMERDVRAAIKSGRKSCVLELMKRRNKTRMTSSVINAALKRKDPVMREVMERAQRYLGILVANVVNLLDPECVVIGGGLAGRLGELYVGPIREYAHEHFFREKDVKRVRIVPGKLADNAGAFGAVVVARRRLR
ncbi:MAG TPA: ROK family protein [Terriglobia bacterium]|nr:ROK family protein [Terriglobia bacterium]